MKVDIESGGTRHIAFEEVGEGAVNSKANLHYLQVMEVNAREVINSKKIN